MEAPQHVSVPAHAGLSLELSQFFETAFHLLLHDRGLYPPGLFDARRAYGVSCVSSRHPLLNAYVSQLASSVRSWLVRGETQRIVLVVLDPPRSETNDTATPVCIERFVFELCTMQNATTAAAAAAADSPLSSDDLAILHEQFAAVLTRLASCDGHFTAKRPKTLSWTVLLYTNQATPTVGVSLPSGATSARTGVAGASTDDARRWHALPICAHDAFAASSAAAAGLPQTPFLDFHPNACRIMPIKSVRTAPVHMEVYAEAAGERV